jgi:hypothetical protein
VTDDTATHIKDLFRKLRQEHPADFIAVAEIRNAVLEEAAELADNYAKECWGMTEELSAAENIAHGIRSLKSGDSK